MRAIYSYKCDDCGYIWQEDRMEVSKDVPRYSPCENCGTSMNIVISKEGEVHEVEGFLVDECDGYTEHYWVCGCEKDNIRGSWFERECEECGIKKGDGKRVSMEDVIVELRRDGRLQKAIKEYFEKENEYYKNVKRGQGVDV